MKNRANDVAALISNWEQVENATESAENAQGSASREHEKYMESLQGHLDVLKSKWESFSMTVMDTDFLNTLIDGAGNLLDALSGVIEFFESIPGVNGTFVVLAGTIGALLTAFKNFGFATINKQATSFSQQLQFMGKSVNTISRDLKNGQGAINSFFGNIRYKNGITPNDVKCLTAFKQQIDAGVPTAKAWQQTMTGASVAGKKMAGSVKTGAISIKSLTAATNTSRVAMIGATAAAIALEAALTMGIMIAITAIVSALGKLVNASQEASEAADDFATETRETSDASQEELASLDELIAKYQELASQDTRDIGVRAEIRDVQQQIADLVGDQAAALDLVNGSLDQQLEKLQSIQHAQAETTLEDTSSAYYAAKEAADKSLGEGKVSLMDKAVGLFTGVDYAWRGDITNEEMELLDKLGAEYNLTAGWLPSAPKTSEGWGTGFSDVAIDVSHLETAADKVEYIESIIESLENSNIDISSSDLYQGLQDSLNHFSQYVDDTELAASNMLSAAMTVAQSDDKISEMYVNSAESLAEYRSAMVDYIKNTPEMQQAIKEGSITEGDIKKQVDQFLSTSEDYSDYFSEWYEDIQSSFDMQDRLGINLTDLIGAEDAKIVNTEVDSYIENVNKLSDALESMGDGDFSDKDLKDLISEFPELANIMDELGIGAENADVAVMELMNRLGDTGSGLMDAFGSINIKNMTDDDIAAMEQFQDAVLELGNVVGNTYFSIDITSETEGFEAVTTALTESVTAAGLSQESIDSLRSRYASLAAEGYDLDAMFEETANGIHINREAFDELESAYAQSNIDGLNDSLASLKTKYDLLTTQINNCTDAGERAALYAQRDAITEQINDTATLAAQYEGLTSAYNAWNQAKDAGEERDMYEGIIEGREEIEDELSRGWIDDAAIEYIELLTGKTGLAGKSAEELVNAYNSLDKSINSAGYSINDFFTANEDGESTSEGVFNFLDTVKAAQEKLGKDWVKIDKDGGYSFDFGVNGDAAVAEAIGVSEELVQIMLRAADDAGFVVQLDGAYTQLADLEDAAVSANNELKKLGKTDYTFNFATDSLEDLDAEITKAGEVLDKFRNKDGTINYGIEGAKEAETVMSMLLAQKHQLTRPAYMDIETSEVSEEMQEPLKLLQDYRTSVENIDRMSMTGADTTEAEKNLDDIAKQLANLDNDTKVELGFEADDGYKDVKRKIENGKVTVPTELSIEEQNAESLASMSKSLEEIKDGEIEVELSFNIIPKIQKAFGNIRDWIREKLKLDDTEQKQFDDVSANIGVNPIPKILNGIKVFWDKIKERLGIGSSGEETSGSQSVGETDAEIEVNPIPKIKEKWDGFWKKVKNALGFGDSGGENTSGKNAGETDAEIEVNPKPSVKDKTKPFWSKVKEILGFGDSESNNISQEEDAAVNINPIPKIKEGAKTLWDKAKDALGLGDDKGNTIEAENVTIKVENIDLDLPDKLPNPIEWFKEKFGVVKDKFDTDIKISFNPLPELTKDLPNPIEWIKEKSGIVKDKASNFDFKIFITPFFESIGKLPNPIEWLREKLGLGGKSGKSSGDGSVNDVAPTDVRIGLNPLPELVGGIKNAADWVKEKLNIGKNSKSTKDADPTDVRIGFNPIPELVKDLPNPIKWIKEKFGAVKDGFDTDVKVAFNPLPELSGKLKDVKEWIKEKLNLDNKDIKNIKAITKIFISPIPSLIENAGVFWDKIKKKLGLDGGSDGGGGKTIKGNATVKVSSDVELAEKASSIWSKIKKKLGIDSIKELPAKVVLDVIPSLAKGAGKTISNFLNGLFGNGNNGANTKKNVTLSASANGTDAVQALADTVKNIPSNKAVTVTATVAGKNDAVTLSNAIRKIVSKVVAIVATVAGTGAVNALRAAISRVKKKTVKVAAKVSGTDRVNDLSGAIRNVSGKSISVSVSGVSDATTKVNNLVTALSKIKNKNVSISVTTSGSVGVNGTAYAKGTAFKNGDWGTRNSGTALVGELGQELLVRDGHFYTIGDNSAELIQYKKGDIIK